GQVRTGEYAVGEREAAFSRQALVKGRVTRVMNDVVSAGLEFGGHARERRGAAGDFGEPVGLATAQQVRDALPLVLGARQIAGGVCDEQYAEFALLASRGV